MDTGKEWISTMKAVKDKKSNNIAKITGPERPGGEDCATKTTVSSRLYQSQCSGERCQRVTRTRTH